MGFDTKNQVIDRVLKDYYGLSTRKLMINIAASSTTFGIDKNKHL